MSIVVNMTALPRAVCAHTLLIPLELILSGISGYKTPSDSQFILAMVSSVVLARTTDTGVSLRQRHKFAGLVFR